MALPPLAPPFSVRAQIDGMCLSVISSEVSPRQHSLRYWHNFAPNVFVLRRPS
jgi:hypothetical protein